MEVPCSAAVRALSVSELLALIFISLREEKPTLATCMRVNKQWMSEAVRVLWYRCGEGGGPIQGYLPLRLRDLVALAPNPERLQWYANNIRYLQPSEDNRYKKIDGKYVKITPTNTGKIKHESRYYERLKDIDFPHLKKLVFCRSCYYRKRIDPKLFIPFLKPTLENLRVLGHLLPLSFYKTLKNECRILKHLTLDTEKDDILYHQPSRASLEHEFEMFLLNTPTLEDVSLGGDAFQPWTENIFRALALLPSLSKLCIPIIFESWTLNNRNSSSIIFPSLERLDVQVTDVSFENLAPNIRKVTELRVHLSGPSSRAVRIASSISTLQTLSIDPGTVSFTFHAADLLAMARECSSLINFSLNYGFYEEDPPKCGKGFSDAVMDEVAKCLPNLENFSMILDVEEILTEKTLLSLGTWCKKLRRVGLCADVNFLDFVIVGENNAFPSLDSLHVESPVLEWSVCEDARFVVQMLQVIAPSLDYFCTDRYRSDEDGHDLDSEWRNRSS